MGIQTRQVKNKRDSEGKLTGRPGTVYDVSISYRGVDGKTKSYHKKGFATRQEATLHEAQMKAELTHKKTPLQENKDGKKYLSDYLKNWLDTYAANPNNIKHNTYIGYKSNINVHIIPELGNIRLADLTANDLDSFYNKLFTDKKLKTATVRYVHRTLSVALGHAAKKGAIRSSPTSAITTKFPNNSKTPDPYSIEEMQKLIKGADGSKWQFLITVSGLYGLRRNEALGLTRGSINLEKAKDSKYGLLLFREEGEPIIPEHVSRQCNGYLQHLELRHIRFHDLRHTPTSIKISPKPRS